MQRSEKFFFFKEGKTRKTRRLEVVGGGIPGVSESRRTPLQNTFNDEDGLPCRPYEGRHRPYHRRKVTGTLGQYLQGRPRSVDFEEKRVTMQEKSSTCRTGRKTEVITPYGGRVREFHNLGEYHEG